MLIIFEIIIYFKIIQDIHTGKPHFHENKLSSAYAVSNVRLPESIIFEKNSQV
jgi:hypothetical protein